MHLVLCCFLAVNKLEIDCSVYKVGEQIGEQNNSKN